jgi:hypothetical protein
VLDSLLAGAARDVSAAQHSIQALKESLTARKAEIKHYTCVL